MLFWASLVLLMTGLMSMGRTLDKRAISGAELPVAVQKRPFCNAFTGCGRKRSDDSYIPLPIGQGAAFEQNDMTGGDSKFWDYFQQRLLESPVLRAMVLNEMKPRLSALDLATGRRRRSVSEDLSFHQM